MTQAELLGKVFNENNMGNGRKILKFEDLEKFFESNVIIPRGENRHPYADIYHEYFEDTTKVLQMNCGGENDWRHMKITDSPARIKPSEPIYEWQWKIRNFIYGGDVTEWKGFTPYLTEPEFADFKMKLTQFQDYERDESTKRIRE